MTEHGGAIEYDLMTRTRYTLDDIGGALPYRALRHFLQHVGHDSALWRETHPETLETDAWEQGAMTAAILADVYDAIEALRQTVVAAHGGRVRRHKPYPRPWRKERNKRRIGGKPIRVGDFDAWWEENIRR